MARDKLERDVLEGEQNDEGYNEEEDEDFNPDAVRVEDEAMSSDDSEPEQSSIAKKRRKTTAASGKKQDDYGSGDANADIDFENSGDEGIIKEGTKQERKQRSRRKEDNQDGEDAAGEGLFVQTRSMRAAA